MIKYTTQCWVSCTHPDLTYDLFHMLVEAVDTTVQSWPTQSNVASHNNDIRWYVSSSNLIGYIILLLTNYSLGGHVRHNSRRWYLANQRGFLWPSSRKGYFTWRHVRYSRGRLQKDQRSTVICWHARPDVDRGICEAKIK